MLSDQRVMVKKVKGLLKLKQLCAVGLSVLVWLNIIEENKKLSVQEEAKLI